MSNSEAVSIIKGHIPDCSREEIRNAWQHLIDDGVIWRMNKWWTDMAACQIAAGTVERNAA